jgi:hypothetical protein
MSPTCVHSCKGLCTALSVAEHLEEEAIAEYRRFAMECDYPEIKELLESLVADRERMLAMLREKRDILIEKFNVIDRINDSFA